MQKRVLLMLLVAGVLFGNSDVSAMEVGIREWFEKKIDVVRKEIFRSHVKWQYQRFLHADRYACSDWELAEVLDDAYQLEILGDLLFERDRDGNTLFMRCVIADGCKNWWNCRQGQVKMIINAAKSVNKLNDLLSCQDRRGLTVLNWALYAECSGIFYAILKEANEAQGFANLLDCSLSVDPRDRMYFLKFRTIAWQPFSEIVGMVSVLRSRDCVIEYAENMLAGLHQLPVAQLIGSAPVGYAQGVPSLKQ